MEGEFEEVESLSEPLRPADVMARIQRFEDFIAGKLQPDLEKLLDERDEVYECMAQYLKLKNQIDMIKSIKDDKPMKTMVNIGCDFHIQALINKDRIFVQVGLDTHVELTLDEALAFIGTKEKRLQRRADVHTDKIAMVKSRIKFMLAAIQQLLDSQNRIP